MIYKGINELFFFWEFELQRLKSRIVSFEKINYFVNLNANATLRTTFIHFKKLLWLKFFQQAGFHLLLHG